MRSRRAGTLLLAAVLSSGCEAGGQTGSPDCQLVLSCACATVSGKVPMIGKVVASDPDTDTVTLRIERLLHPENSKGFRVSDLVHGHAGRANGCASGPAPSLAPGDAVFAAVDALFGIGVATDCTAVESCDAASECEGGGAAHCVSGDGRDIQMSFEILLAPAGDPLDFGDGTEVALSEVPTLEDPLACDGKYPPPDHPPCNDTPTTPSAGCAVAVKAPAPSGRAGGLFAVLAMALLAAKRRRADATMT